MRLRNGPALAEQYAYPYPADDSSENAEDDKMGKTTGLPLPGSAGYDVESGLGASSRVVKRFLTRRTRIVIGCALGVSLLVWLQRPRRGPPPQPWSDGYEHEAGYDAGWAGDDDGDGDDGWGASYLDKGPPRPLLEKPLASEYIVDQNGDHYLLHAEQDIAPMHPDLSLLPAASALFAEVDLDSHFRPPTSEPYPDAQLRAIISDPPDLGSSLGSAAKMPDEAFFNTWEPPEVWDAPRGELLKVQWEGFETGKTWETAAEKDVRLQRREAVRRGFAHAWQAYKDYAWGHDEIKPVSKIPSDPFNNWGASIIDTLDTLLLMGFSDEYTVSRPHVNQVNFHWVGGRDWSQGFEDEPDEDGEVYGVPRDRTVGLPVFETGIRYLGGMLGAYDLSGDTLLVERAVDLADILGRAFVTASGLPAGRMDPAQESGFYTLATVSLAEVGSMSLELIRLAQITGDRKWFDLAQRATDYLDQRVAPRSIHPPLIPMWFQPNAQASVPLTGGWTLGGLADSYYEYLVKAYKLLGASELAAPYRRLYEGSVDAARDLLMREITTIPGRDLVTFGKSEAGRYILETEHLSCFAGAMLGLGAKLLGRPQDMDDALRFTQTCYWLSAATPTGLQPEVVEFFQPLEVAHENVTADGHPYIPNFDLEKMTPIQKTLVHKDREGIWRWNNGQRVEETKSEQGFVEYRQQLKGQPPGSKKVVGRGINRPETIESIFYMFRLTGDRKWQEKGWKMFVSWSTAAKVEGGLSSLDDVTKPNFQHSDNMESFMFAETLKYHFLLQSEPDVLSLDDYVLNTEAHPLLTSADIASGSQGYWHAPAEQDLGVRGQGTDAQKWTRAAILDAARARRPSKNSKVGAGGGRGMGGGGGRQGKPLAVGPQMVKIST